MQGIGHPAAAGVDNAACIALPLLVALAVRIRDAMLRAIMAGTLAVVG